MSAFLGPIHHWLYNKIQIQQELIEGIIEISNKNNDRGMDLLKELNNRYGESEKRPLEEVIDVSNIHGWLQTLVSQVEYKLAYGASIMLERNPEQKEEIESFFYKKGQEKSLLEASANPSEIYKAISDSLLDGMPCDHAYSVVEESEDHITWKRNACVHKQYYDAVGGDAKNYYDFREAFIKGFLSNMSVTYEQIDDVTSIIKRSDKNE